jgi:hypothetical protein
MVAFGHVVGELSDELAGLVRVGDRVDAADGLLRMPREPDVATRVAGSEQSEELRLTTVIETS